MAESNLERAESRVREMREMTQNYVRQSNNMFNNAAVQQNNNQPPPPIQNQNITTNQHTHQQQGNNIRNMQNNRNTQNMFGFNQPRFEKVNTQNHNRTPNPSQNPINYNTPPPPPPQQINEEHKQPTSILNNLLGSLPFNLKIDDEKIIILALIILLSREKADIKLIIALAYLIM